MHRSRYQREQSEYRKCTRPGCDRDAVVRLTYDIVGCQVWIDGLEGVRGRTQELCELHLGRLTIPRGWALSDRRVETEVLVSSGTRAGAGSGALEIEPEAVEVVPESVVPESVIPMTDVVESIGEVEGEGEVAVEGSDDGDRDEDRDRDSSEDCDGDALSRETDTQPVTAANTPETTLENTPENSSDGTVVATDDDGDSDESIPEELRAGSPLLSRAFRAAGGSKSLVEDTVNPPLRIPERES